VKGRLLLNVVVGQSAAVLEPERVSDTRAGKCDEARWQAQQHDARAGDKGGWESERWSASRREARQETAGRAMRGHALLASEDEPLLVRGDALLVLDLGLDVVDRVGRLDLERDRLAGERLDEDLHGC